jgi:hypothetical protein
MTGIIGFIPSWFSPEKASVLQAQAVLVGTDFQQTRQRGTTNRQI